MFWLSHWFLFLALAPDSSQLPVPTLGEAHGSSDSQVQSSFFSVNTTNMMHRWFVEVGWVACVSLGPCARRLVLVVVVIDQNSVLVDAPALG